MHGWSGEHPKERERGKHRTIGRCEKPSLFLETGSVENQVKVCRQITQYPIRLLSLQGYAYGVGGLWRRQGNSLKIHARFSFALGKLSGDFPHSPVYGMLGLWPLKIKTSRRDLGAIANILLFATFFSFQFSPGLL